MGGNVFKDGSTRRYNAVEYYSLCDRLQMSLSKVCKKYGIIPAYKSKESFGDVDILIIPSLELSKQLLASTFNTTFEHVVHNGDVWSLVFEEIQVDLITTDDNEYDASYDYFSWNDFGNLRGKIIHKFGLKFGHNGLIFPVRSNDHLLGEIVLSRDPKVINAVFDFEYGKEYNTLEEMFDTVIKSKYFNPSVFAWEEMNAVARIRDKKRATYHAFLKYIENIKVDKVYMFNRDKTGYHSFIFDTFPDAKVEFDKLWAKKLLVDSAATKFNGDLVKQITGREGKELGSLMIELKRILIPETVVSLSESEIKSIISEYDSRI